MTEPVSQPAQAASNAMYDRFVKACKVAEVPIDTGVKNAMDFWSAAILVLKSKPDPDSEPTTDPWENLLVETEHATGADDSYQPIVHDTIIKALESYAPSWSAPKTMGPAFEQACDTMALKPLEAMALALIQWSMNVNSVSPRA